MDTTLEQLDRERQIPLVERTMDKKELKTLEYEVTGGSLGEALGGAGAIVLAILGLIGLIPIRLGAIAAIAVGAAMLLGGGVMALRFTQRVTAATDKETGELVGGGLAFESLCGVAGVVLGILALINIAPFTLLAIAALVLGAGLVLAGGATARLNRILSYQPDVKGRMAAESVDAASGAETAIGLGALVLGILALAGVSPLPLVLVSMLVLGVSVLLSGSAVALRILRLFG